MPRKTFLLIAFLTFITFALVYLAVSERQTPKTENLEQNTNSSLPQTTLSISSNPTSYSSGSATFYETNVIIDTGSNKIRSVQLELSFDPDMIKNVDINPGSFLINPIVLLKNIDEKTGRITFALSSSDNQGALGQGILAKISFKTLKKSVSTTIDFLPKTKVSAEDTAESVLKSTVGALFNLGATPTLIISPTATPAAN